MLLNLSTHPADGWTPEQRDAAEPFGAVEDVAFPRVPPEADAGAGAAMADDLAAQLQQRLAEAGTGPHAVHLMGESTLTAALVARLQRAGVHCLAATTERHVEQEADGQRRVHFAFVRFRDYPPLCP